jgi:hypothetical protein
MLLFANIFSLDFILKPQVKLEHYITVLPVIGSEYCIVFQLIDTECFVCMCVRVLVKTPNDVYLLYAAPIQVSVFCRLL